MERRPDWVPETIDVEQPSAARIYDYLLGGSHNFAVDREFARQVMAVLPDGPVQAHANRAFLRRAVQYLAEAGIRQFLDIGSGIPTLGNVHEVARQAVPDARVVYVDVDPVAAAHGRAILAGDDRATVIQEDLRHPDRILAHPELRTVLDLDRPVAVLLVAILHVIPDADDPHGIVARLRDALAPGSWLAIAHGTDESRPAEVEELRRLSEKTPTPLVIRSRAEVTRFFGGWELVEPGLVWAPQWHPDSPDDVGTHPEMSGNLVGAGRKR
jgi:SAM-dependent methyltransferase